MSTADAGSGFLVVLDFGELGVDDIVALRAALRLSLSAARGEVAAPSPRGIAIVRRLTPDAASRAQIEAIRGNDRCDILTPPAPP